MSFALPALTDREKTAHLLRRFAFGASESEIDFYLTDGYQSAVEKLLDYADTPNDFDVDVASLRPDEKRPLNMPILVAWWTTQMLVSRQPLAEKMTLFWHDHFATSASKVKNAYMMQAQNNTMREHATGNFRTLLLRMSQDPAMLNWLDNQENVKGKPNENFAREVMELFTLGIDGGYSESDVREAARAFTGWSYRRGLPATGGPKFLFRPNLHDAGPKSLLGTSGRLTGEDVLNHLCDMNQTSLYITEKLIRWFVTPNPEKAYVDRMNAEFRRNDLELKPLLRAMMLSPEFVSSQSVRRVLKNPADFCVTTARQLGYGRILRANLSAQLDTVTKKRGAIGPAFQTTVAMKNMGMQLMYPPDVAGWEGGQSWISSATMVERMGWSAKLFGTSSKGNLSRYPVGTILSDVDSPTALVNRLASIFDAPILPERRPVLESAAKEAMKGSNLAPAAVAVSRLIFASPEFQFA